MRKLFAVPAVAAVMAAGVAVTGCASSFDTKDLQTKLGADVAGQTGLKVADVSVSCPDDASADKGTKFTCTVTAGKQKQDIAVVVTDDEGGVSWNIKQ